MEILIVDLKVGEKAFFKYKDSLMECVFLGTFGDGGTDVYYKLKTPTLRVINVPFDRAKEFSEWYYETKASSCLYKSVEDYKNNKPISCRYGASDNCHNSDLFRERIPSLLWYGNDGARAFFWDGTKAIFVQVHSHNARWKFDENGFKWSCLSFDIFDHGTKIACATLDDLYTTKSACEADNVINVVSFDDDRDDDSDTEDSSNANADSDSSDNASVNSRLYTFVSKADGKTYNGILDHISKRGVIYIKTFSRNKKSVVSVKTTRFGNEKDYRIMKSGFAEFYEFYTKAFTTLTGEHF